MNNLALPVCVVSRGVLAVALAAVGCLICEAGERQPAGETPAASLSEREERLAEMRRFAESFAIQEIDGDAPTAVRLVAEPVLRFTDPVRLHDDGTLWVWGTEGRPRAFSEVYLKDGTGTAVYHGLTSTADSPLVARRFGRVVWSPRSAASEFTPVPDAPRPADNSSARVNQMKQIASRFSAYEVFPEDQRWELRLLAKPVHLYADESAGILSGGVFVLALGTNPEVLLLVEAFRRDGGAQWMYSVARRGNAPLFVELDGDIVWQKPNYSEGAAQDTFFYSIVQSR